MAPVSDGPFDVGIVGAGIVGASCAYWAAREGLSVVVVEAREPAGGTTGAGMGHVVALDRSEPALLLARYSQRLWQELAPSLPAAVGYRAAGTLWVAATPDDLARAEARRDGLRRHGIPAEMVDATFLAREEPALRSGLAGGLLVPEDALLVPAEATRALLARAEEHGARVLAHRPVLRLAAGTIETVSGPALRARRIVNAAGVDAPRLSPQVPIAPRKGTLVRLGVPGVPIHHQLVELGYRESVGAPDPVSVVFNAQPEPGGTVLLGASREWGATDTSVDPAVTGRLRRRALDFAPLLGSRTTVAAWSGLRPATPDHLPWIGPLPGGDDLWVAAGHEGLGITASLGTGRLLVDLLLGRPPALSPTPYLPDARRVPGPDGPPTGGR